MSSSALVLVQSPAPENPPAPRTITLRQAEQNLFALIESADSVSPEQEQEYSQDLDIALSTAIEKRDGVQAFLVYAEALAESRAREIERLKAGEQFLNRVIERVKESVVRTIMSLPLDRKGKFRKLEGRTVTFRIQKNPDSVEIFDESAVPLEHKRFVLRIPATLWEKVLDSIEIELRGELVDGVKVQGCDISKTSVKQAIDAGTDVPGARPAKTTYHLRRQ